MAKIGATQCVVGDMSRHVATFPAKAKWLHEFVCVQDGPHQRVRFGHIAPADSLAACDLHEQGGAAHERRESR